MRNQEQQEKLTLGLLRTYALLIKAAKYSEAVLDELSCDRLCEVVFSNLPATQTFEAHEFPAIYKDATERGIIK